MISERFQAMGTTVEFLIPTSQSEKVEQTIHAAKNRIDDLVQKLSRFLADSEINRVNQQPRQWIQVSPDTLAVLKRASDAFRQTKGLFNPCLGSVLETLGYVVSFEEIADVPIPSQPIINLPYIPPIRCPYALDEEGVQVRLESGYKIDLGGIGKGWIIDQAATVFIENGIRQFICSAGGDMVCHGQNGEIPWCVAILDPKNQEQALLHLDIVDLCVATSGTYRRQWKQGGKMVHHIVDPFRGESTRTDVESCTVIHSNLIEAEIYAKVGVLLGASAAATWFRDIALPGWVLVKGSGEVVCSWN